MTLPIYIYIYIYIVYSVCTDTFENKLGIQHECREYLNERLVNSSVNVYHPHVSRNQRRNLEHLCLILEDSD